jgi:chromosome segregation ATPase
MSNAASIGAVLAALAAVIGAALSYRASTRANATSDRKVDLEEFRDQQTRYKEMLSEADRHIDRIRSQLDRVQDQLGREQDVSNLLRNEVRSLQGQVDMLERTMSRNYREIKPPPAGGGPLSAHPPRRSRDDGAPA